MIYKDPGFHWKGIIMRGKKLLRRQIIWLFLRTPIVVGITSFGIGQGLNPGLDREKHEVIDFETDGSGSVITSPCKTCSGSGRHRGIRNVNIKIPPGVDTGTRLRIRGKGESGFRNGSTGDLYVRLLVEPHEFLEREGDDLYCRVPVSFIQAALGYTLEIPTLNGTKTLEIKPGTQPGDTYRFKGEGVSHLQGYVNGEITFYLAFGVFITSISMSIVGAIIPALNAAKVDPIILIQGTKI